jgi:leucyl aminopeptidase
MKFSFNLDLEKTVVLPCFLKREKVEFFKNSVDKNLLSLVKDKLNKFEFNCKNGNTIFLDVGEYKILLVGVCEKYILEDLRKSYSSVFKFLKDNKETRVSVVFPDLEKFDTIKAVVEGLDLTDYKFDKYLSDKYKFDIKYSFVLDKKFTKQINEVIVVNSNTKIVRDMVNENACDMTPKKLESVAKVLAKKNKLKIKVLDEKKIISEKLGLLNAVGKGSVNPPRLIIVEYSGDKKSSEKIALVGKGITFDTGGINLKPSGAIEEMRLDMGGAATAFGAFKSAVELGLKKNLILVMSCAENAISGSAYIPGDVFVSHSGKSVEIKNTDAEGRLVLADGLSYVQKHFKPTKIIDLATLTGACLVALGPSLIAILGNDEKFEEEIYSCGENVCERGWRLPIHDEHRDLLKSEVADFSNLGGKMGGCISAAAFLEKFIEKNISWVHMDIAGAAFSEKENNYVPVNATGRGVRLLVNYFENN